MSPTICDECHTIQINNPCRKCFSEIKERLAKAEQEQTLQPIETAPRDGTYILLFGPSGYTTTPMRGAVGHYDPEYRPLNPWQTHSNDAFTDDGGEPTHWMPLPQKQEDQ